MTKPDKETDDVVMSRRELARGLAALGLAGGVLASTSSEAEEPAPLTDDARQALVERLVNSRYVVDEQGYITLSGEIWSGKYGSLDHQEWLFNATDGLKASARAALSKSISEGGSFHDGVDPGPASDHVDSIMGAAETLGLLGEDNLIYYALRQKMLHNREHGFDEAMDGFQEWFSQLDDVSDEVKTLVAQKAVEFRSRPVAMQSHDW